ncbi:TIGR03084 family metal-binding protein [Actinomarinicola tropica]|uniref:TIGR03084 family protein n=1 Tax=Actinomarinicola tropica TaxID=2789776 RepID=A0A5Q2REN3_9ACTN|nr:TIGR03084 family metal-binding protein [Actinomarinicola tropica]QGG94074.1 TIGR03084 family protein [Actinomarinicola tropica]
MTDLASITADLRAEQDSLDAVVADLPPERWDTPTASPGWSVRDQIGHLTYFDGTAKLAITDADAFQAALEELMASGGDMERLTLFRDLTPAELLERWRAGRAELLEAATTLQDGQRVPWYGPSMSAKSFLTARLMECWAHGTDVVDAVGGDRPPTDRLRHVAQIGFITRGWTYANRGEEVPPGDVRVELDPPGGGEPWTFGPEGAEATVRGPAEHFCQVVTQRRHLDDTDLVVEGDIALDWLRKAQAYAGPPTEGPAPRRAR